MRRLKSKSSIKDARAADLSNGTFVYLDDDINILYRVVESTQNGIVFARISNWYSEEKIFRYRHSIREMTILEMPRVHSFIFRSFRDWPDGVNNRNSYNELAPSEASITRFIQRWGRDAFCAYIGGVRSFAIDDGEGHSVEPIILADILHFLPFVPAASDRKNLAEHARHKVVRALFQTTLKEKKSA